MTTPLRCLIVEDSEDDARLVLRNLQAGGFAVTSERVETAEAMRAALQHQRWDIVLSDYKLPHFSGRAALAELQASGQDLPFIIVSGTVGEELAVDAMKAGAHDYVMKDKLARLGPAVRREIGEAAVRRQRRHAETALRLQGAALAAAANAIVITDREGIIVWVNDAFTALTGYPFAEAVGRNPRDLVKSGRQDEAFYEELWATITAGRMWRGELVNRRKDGSLYPEEQTITPVRDAAGEITHFIAIKQDLTDRQAVDQLVQASRRQFQAVFDQAAVGMVIADGPHGVFRNVNRRFCELVGYTAEELRQLSSHDLTHPDDVAGDSAQLEQIASGLIPHFSREKRYRRQDGSYVWAKAFVAPLDPSDPQASLRIGVIEDITARKAAEEVLHATEERFIRQRDALIRLAGTENGQHRDLATIVRQITETSARVLKTSRVSLWRYTADRSALRCVDLYELAADRHTSGLELSAASYPAYFRALEQMDVIAVEDPERDPRTCEFTASYLRPLGITSMLDAGIHVHGKVEGVLCHEQTGAPRAWTSDEHTFAAALANLASLAIVEAQRRAAEEALRGAEQKLRTIVEHSTQIFYTHTPDNVLTYISPQSREMLDCEPAEAMRRWTEFLTDHPDNATGVALTQAAIDSGRQQRPYQLELRTPRGRICWVEVRESPVVVDGKTVAIAGALTDITERKRADEALRESDRFNRGTLDALGAHVAVLDADGNILATNQAWRAFAEANAALWPTVSEGTNYRVVCQRAAAAGSDDAARTLEGFRDVVGGTRFVWSHEYPCHSPTAERWFYCRITRFPGEGLVRVVIAHEDISALKRAQSAQRQSENRFRQFFEHTPDIIYSLAPTGEFTALNEAFDTVTGWARADWLGRPFLDLIHPDDHARARARFQTVLSGEQPAPSVELRLRTATGGWRDIEVTGFSSQLGDGRTELQGIVRDITERKAAERLLREQAEIIANAQEGVMIVNLSDEITFWNRGAEQIFGCPAANALGRTPESVLGLADLEQVAKLRVAVERDGFWQGELRSQTRDNRQIFVDCRTTLVRDDGGRPRARLSFLADITEKKLLEEKFLHAQRLESLGLLAAGIAHDLNNVLAPIVFAAPMLRDSLATERDLKILSTLERSAERGTGLVKQILGFAHSNTGELRPTQVKHLARDITDVIESTFPKSIRFEHQIPSDLWPVLGNATQIHQVLLNLCVNARDAMPRGGTLRLAASNRQLDHAAAQALPGAQPGNWLVLEISDTGTGIPPDVLAHIWDPFFTTKAVGKGTGLGLSTVRGIVATHRGFITVDTQPGHGTTFRVYLPAAEDPVHAAVQSSHLNQAGHGELILVVDDEAAIRETVAAVLKHHGYRVLLASDGVEAVSLFNTHAAAIAVVITDVDMPLLDGSALARILGQLKPGLPVIQMSGLAEANRGPSQNPFAVNPATAFLQKPFTSDRLLEAVTRLLPSPAAPEPSCPPSS